jgi:catechol 2,3-dioxygenase-like lactoylglutathione lyase family enzyme
MKRFHVHVAVDDLPASIGFYSKLFGKEPAKQQPDYAKWILDDPRLNFAISSRGHSAGVNHFGFQAESPEELAGLKQLAEAAAAGLQRVKLSRAELTIRANAFRSTITMQKHR